jgi:hypothetical protein
VGQARFGMVILLVLFAGKYRDTIQLIPEIIGFSMYQASGTGDGGDGGLGCGCAWKGGGREREQDV